MFLFIDGWFASGKGVLWSLLQGHPEVYCSVLHDFSFMPLLEEKSGAEWLKEKHCLHLRRLLAPTQYYKAQLLHHAGYMSMDLSSSVRMELPFHLDFYAFDKHFFQSLNALDSWTPEQITESLYRSMMKTDAPEHPDPNYFAAMGIPRVGIRYREAFAQNFPNSKTILVRRDVASIIATRSNRKALKEDILTRNFYDRKLMDRLKSNEVEKILCYEAAFDIMAGKVPDRFLSVEFHDLISNTDETMEKIADFLGIPDHPALHTPTLLGQVLEKDGVSYIGGELDKLEDLLTAKEIGMIEKRRRIHQWHGLPYHPFSKAGIRMVLKNARNFAGRKHC